MQTDRFSPVVNYIKDLLDENKYELEIEDVWYGDQNLIPRTPAVAVEAGPFSRTLSGIGGKGRTDNSIAVYILVYANKISETQRIKKTADELAEEIMDVLHKDVTLDGLVIHGHVTSIEPGYSVRGTAMFRSARVTWEGLTKTLIS